MSLSLTNQFLIKTAPFFPLVIPAMNEMRQPYQHFSSNQSSYPGQILKKQIAPTNYSLSHYSIVQKQRNYSSALEPLDMINNRYLLCVKVGMSIPELKEALIILINSIKELASIDHENALKYMEKIKMILSCDLANKRGQFITTVLRRNFEDVIPEKEIIALSDKFRQIGNQSFDQGAINEAFPLLDYAWELRDKNLSSESFKVGNRLGVCISLQKDADHDKAYELFQKLVEDGEKLNLPVELIATLLANQAASAAFKAVKKFSNDINDALFYSSLEQVKKLYQKAEDLLPGCLYEYSIQGLDALYHGTEFGNINDYIVYDQNSGGINLLKTLLASVKTNEIYQTSENSRGLRPSFGLSGLGFLAISYKYKIEHRRTINSKVLLNLLKVMKKIPARANETAHFIKNPKYQSDKKSEERVRFLAVKTFCTALFGVAALVYLKKTV